MTPKDTYRTFSEEEPTLPLFSRAWWLDTVCGPDRWDVVLVEKGGQVVAALPYYLNRIMGLRMLTMPPHTKLLGPWVRQFGYREPRRIQEEKDLKLALIEQLPAYAYFAQAFHPSITNWLPFRWAGFEQTTRYTYILEDLSDLDAVWEGFQTKIRGDVRKAQKQGITVRSDLGLDSFLETEKKTFARQGEKFPYDEALLRKTHACCRERDCARMFFAVDADERVHAVAYVVHDEQRAYYLMGGGDPDLRHSGATSLVLWQAIQYAATVTRSFDFVGSIMEPLERFFRGFGGTMTPYSYITRKRSRLVKTGFFLRDLVQG